MQKLPRQLPHTVKPVIALNPSHHRRLQNRWWCFCFKRHVLGGTVLALVIACSPVFNWRQVEIQESGLSALLPCKPDHAKKQLPWGASPSPQALEVLMSGCEAQGNLFAVSFIKVPAHLSASKVQAEWMEVVQAQYQQQFQTLMPTATPLWPAAKLPTNAQWMTSKTNPTQPNSNHQPAMQGIWFHSGAQVFHAVWIANPSTKVDSAVSETFFTGLELKN